jgi:hypothetical protein
MVDVVGSFLHFTPVDSETNSIPEMRCISQERRDDGIGGNDDDDDDIQMTESLGEMNLRRQKNCLVVHNTSSQLLDYHP